MVTHLIPDDEDCDEQVYLPEATDTSTQGVDWNQTPNTPVSFDLDAKNHPDSPAIVEDEEDATFQEKPAAEFLRWHHKLNHMSGAKMQSMAKSGLLPKVGNMPNPNLHQLLVWEGHQETLENQAQTWTTRWQAQDS
ncbi:hypothetical protein MHU86_12285 [Fragilaria crotonensis]|nr:hypothetical protein MHU86_12285 [Fragilaria crotonensis]